MGEWQVGMFIFVKNEVKWVCGSEWVCVYDAKSLDSFGKFDVFETEVSTTFSLERQRKVVLLDNLPLLMY